MTEDPRTSQPTSFPSEPKQPSPGLETAMRTKPDHGEESYRGADRLNGRAGQESPLRVESGGSARASTKVELRTLPPNNLASNVLALGGGPASMTTTTPPLEQCRA